MQPFLTLASFTSMWDGAALTAQQQTFVNLLLQVASDWIYQQAPSTPATSPAAQFVVYDVVSNAIRFQKYGKLATFSKTTGHRMDAGSFADPMKALEFTDVHRQLLGLPLSALPLTSCRVADFDAQDWNQGWPTRWSNNGNAVGFDVGVWEDGDDGSLEFEYEPGDE